MSKIRALIFGVACLGLLFIVTPSRAQQPSAASEKEQGITLYKNGEYKAAIPLLRVAVKKDKQDAVAWNFLGLSLHRNGEIKDARKAFQTALKIKPDYASARVSLAYMHFLMNEPQAALKEAEQSALLDAKDVTARYIIAAAYLKLNDVQQAGTKVDEALKLKSDFAPALLLRSNILVRKFSQARAEAEKRAPNSNYSAFDETTRLEQRRADYQYLKDAAQNLEQYLKLTPDQAEQSFWRTQLECIQLYARMADAPDPNGDLFPASESLKPTVIYKEKAKYTEAARQAGVQGTVVLKCIFSADGNVKHFLAIQPLSHGLAEQAIIAARKIKFTPAMKDGRPVSVIVNLEFDFRLY